MAIQKQDSLVELVKAIIHEEIIKFKQLGREAKKLKAQGEPLEKIQFVHLEMAEIIHNLAFFKPQLKSIYPEFLELFDKLSVLRDSFLSNVNDTRVDDTCVDDTRVLEANNKNLSKSSL